MTEFELLKTRIDQNITGITIAFDQPDFPDSRVRYFMDVTKGDVCITIEWRRGYYFGIHLPVSKNNINHNKIPDEQAASWVDVLYRVIELIGKK